MLLCLKRWLGPALKRRLSSRNTDSRHSWRESSRLNAVHIRASRLESKNDPFDSHWGIQPPMGNAA